MQYTTIDLYKFFKFMKHRTPQVSPHGHAV